MATFFTGSGLAFAETSYKSQTALKAVGDTSGLTNLPRIEDPLPPPTYDVLIAGSGPVGTTYARILVEKGYNVVMVDVGDQDSPKRGYHKKNTIGFQKDIDKFVHVINGALSTVSVPVNQTVVNTLNPSVWRADKPFVRNGMNPEQDPFRNLPAQAVTRAVGGMATHWTCATPRFNRLERPLLDRNAETSYNEWERLYGIAEDYIGTGTGQFDKSIRHNLVLRTLDGTDGRKFQHLPLACTRRTETFVEWHSANTIFNLEDAPNETYPRGRFNLLANTQCTRLIREAGSNKIVQAHLHNFEDGQHYTVNAQVFIIAAGAIATPQVLVNSGFHHFGREDKPSLIPNLGKYITEQTMTFCQVILHQSLVDEVKADIKTSGSPGEPGYRVWFDPSPNNKNPDWWNQKVVAHMLEHQEDPLPIPFTDPEPQVTTLFAAKKDYNWHTQIHRDAFSYGAVAESIDSRLIVDFRWFGRTEGIPSNQLYFSEKYTDLFAMPQPTFHYSLPPGQTTTEANTMIGDMIDIAAKVGGFLPGSEPQFMAPGLALHLGGSHRSGLEPAESVVDIHSKVWEFPNLFLGGVGNIPSAFGSNPTLTAIAYAIKSCEFITDNFQPSPLPAQK